MTHERRYSDEEIRRIFSLATTRDADPAAPAPGSPDGLTLPELREIGAEVGVDPDRISRAARTVDARREIEPRRTLLGLPLSAGRTVELERAPTRREWETLVAECRGTFGARGRVSSSEGSREWRNGNLHVSIEPSSSGRRLRMGTRKGDAVPLTLAGAGGLLLAVVTAVFLVASGAPARELLTPAVLAGLGIGALGLNALRLPRWAREREEQMAYLADRAEELIGREGAGPDG